MFLDIMNLSKHLVVHPTRKSRLIRAVTIRLVNLSEEVLSGQGPIYWEGGGRGSFTPKHSSFSPPPKKLPQCNLKVFIDKVLTWLPV